MNYLITIGSQFKQYNEIDLALHINKNDNWFIYSIDANRNLYKDCRNNKIKRICSKFNGQAILKMIKINDCDNIYIYDLVSCAGIFKQSIEFIQLIYKNNPNINIYYRHGNTIFSEHPEEFSMVDEKIIINYPEFLNNFKLSKSIITLYNAYKELSLKNNKPISYYFMERLWEIKRLPKQPFNVDKFIEYIAYIELINIANTFINIKEGTLSEKQKKNILNKTYGIVYDTSNLITQ